MNANHPQLTLHTSPALDSPEMLPIEPSDMRQIEGGRCWDGPLGDRDECPPKPKPRVTTLDLLYGFF